jgi:Uma2 family endonuclease
MADDMVPDLAGWRVERMPKLPKTSRIKLAPDWVCEVLSPRTEATDRAEKMPIYAREGVRHAWLIHPIHRTFEVYSLNASGQWTVLSVHQGAKRVRAEPFEALELDLALLWPDDDEAIEDDEEEGETSPVPPPSASKPKQPVARKPRGTRK